MNEKRYERNRIYLSETDQEKIKKFRILLGGAGIGSNIAEAALRMGFESITIVDGDIVSKSNLNRQNYTIEDIGKPKVEALKARLLGINPDANIIAIPKFIDAVNVESIIGDHDVAINALDFTSDTPFLFDEICARKGITVLHPYNVGFAGVVMVMKPDGTPLKSILEEDESYEGFEAKAIKYVVDYFNYWAKPKLWIEDILFEYKKEGGTLPPPQLSIASTIVAGMTSAILYRLATGGFVKSFPKFYYYSDKDDLN